MAIQTITRSTTTINDGFGAYNATVTAILIQHDTAGAHKAAGDVVLKALFDANTILAADADDTPAALTIAEQRLVGRITSGSIVGLTAAQVLTLISVESGATADQTEAEILTLLGLTSAEVDQIENLGAVTVSAAQWGYFADLETILGTILSTPTTIQGAIQGDTTKGRIMRGINLTVADGTDANTLKCTVISRWNGDVIAQTNNIAKGATTGDFTLSATGRELKIEATGLTGNPLYAIGNIVVNLSTTDLTTVCIGETNDIKIYVYNTSAGTELDMTVLVDTGSMLFDIFYITDA